MLLLYNVAGCVVVFVVVVATHGDGGVEAMSRKAVKSDGTNQSLPHLQTTVALSSSTPMPDICRGGLASAALRSLRTVRN